MTKRASYISDSASDWFALTRNNDLNQIENGYAKASGKERARYSSLNLDGDTRPLIDVITPQPRTSAKFFATLQKQKPTKKQTTRRISRKRKAQTL